MVSIPKYLNKKHSVSSLFARIILVSAILIILLLLLHISREPIADNFTLLLAAIIPGMIILILSLMISRTRQKKAVNEQTTGTTAMSVNDSEPVPALLQDLQNENKYFSGVLSHDLRSPLSSIVLLTSYLKTKNTVQENVHYLDLIEQSARKELDMMANLLFLMRISTADPGKFEKIELKSLVENMLEETKGPVSHKQLDPVVDINEDLQLQIDPDALKLVIKSLIQQAIHYSEDNQQVRIKATESAGQVNFEIKIKGSPQFYQAKDSLFSSDQLRSLNKINTFPDNIGLYFCRKIISSYNGTIHVLGDENEPYCRFMLTFARNIKD